VSNLNVVEMQIINGKAKRAKKQKPSKCLIGPIYIYIYIYIYLLTLLSKKLLFHSSFKSEKEVSYLKFFIKTNIIRVSIE